VALKEARMDSWLATAHAYKHRESENHRQDRLRATMALIEHAGFDRNELRPNGCQDQRMHDTSVGVDELAAELQAMGSWSEDCRK